MDRRIEVFTGAYASGKSEVSINRALMLHKEGLPVTLVDLDTVEPAYTLRPLKNEIEAMGVPVVTQESYFGLGETGNTITATQMNCLSLKGNIVIDVGYGAGGLDILEVISGIDREENLNIYIVINTSKFETSNVDNIIEYVEFSKGTSNYSWKKFSGIVSNTHFSDETTKEDIINGYNITKVAAEKLGIPIVAIGVAENIYPEFGSDTYDGVPLWPLRRLMPKAMW